LLSLGASPEGGWRITLGGQTYDTMSSRRPATKRGNFERCFQKLIPPGSYVLAFSDNIFSVREVVALRPPCDGHPAVSHKF
jgi:hypothetical protein